jgi:four helix bundle protein
MPKQDEGVVEGAASGQWSVISGQFQTEAEMPEARMKLQSYRDLIAWKKGVELALSIYRVTQQLPRDEIYGLTSQLRRGAVSIPSNIAEGQGRASSGEFKQFLGHAYGSLCEVETQLLIAHRLGYLSENEFAALCEASAELGRIINGLIRSIGSDH